MVDFRLVGHLAWDLSTLYAGPDPRCHRRIHTRSGRRCTARRELDALIDRLRGGHTWKPATVPSNSPAVLSAGTVTSARSSTASTRSTGCSARSSEMGLTVGKEGSTSSTPTYGPNT